MVKHIGSSSTPANQRPTYRAEGAPMDEQEITRIISNELDTALLEDVVRRNQRDAYYAYLGQGMPPTPRGRSSIVSTDVTDTIESLVPQVMSAIMRNNDLITFDAMNGEDERQARLESAFVHHMLMQKNDGYNWVQDIARDAALMKNAIPKVYYEKTDRRVPQVFTGISKQTLDVLVSPDDVDVVSLKEEVNEKATKAQMEAYEQQVQMMQQQVMQQAMQQQPGQPMQPPPQIPPPPPPVMRYDVRIEKTETRARVKFEVAPPEQFCISNLADSTIPRDARFCSQVSLRPASEMKEMGFDPDQIDSIAKNQSSNDEDRKFRWWATGERNYSNQGATDDKSQYDCEIAECYIYMDRDGDGISEFYQIWAVGNRATSEILRWAPAEGEEEGELAITEMDEDEHPFPGAVTLIRSPHKFYGLSIYDRVIDLMRLKTGLWRNTLDNIYLTNNQRSLVKRGAVAMDDFLVSRVGGTVRCDNPQTDVIPLVTPSLGDIAMNMMSYSDTVRASRVGVSPGQQITEKMVGSAIGSEGVDRIMTAMEVVQDMFVSQVVEGIKPSFCLARDLMRKHHNIVEDFKFEDEWVQVDPSKWPATRTATVRVGLGSGSSREQLAGISRIYEIQKEVFQQPGQSIIEQHHIYNTIDRICRLSGITNTTAYVGSPMSQEGQQKAQAAQAQVAEDKQKAEQKEMAVIQAQTDLAKAEMGKVQMQGQNNQLKAQTDMLKIQLERAKNEAEYYAKLVDQEGKSEETAFKYAKLHADKAMELTKLETDLIVADRKEDMSQAHKENKDTL